MWEIVNINCCSLIDLDYLQNISMRFGSAGYMLGSFSLAVEVAFQL